MDTKSKSFKYSMGAKIAASIVLWMCFMAAVGSGLYLIRNEMYLNSDSYFDTYIFKDEFSRLVHNVVELNVKLKSEEKIKASGESQEIISNNIERLERIKSRLSNTVNFVYYINNTQTGEAFFNITTADPVAFIKEQQVTMIINQYKADSNYPLSEDIKQMLSGTSYEVYAAVLGTLKPGDMFYDGSNAFSKANQYYMYIIISLISSILLMIASFVYLVFVAGLREKGGEIILSFIDRIYTDVHTLSVFIAAVISVQILEDVLHGFRIESLIAGSIVLSIDVFIGLSYLLSMVRQIKSRRIIKNSLIFRIFIGLKVFVRLCFSGRIFKVWILLLLLGYGGANAIVFAIATHSGSEGFFITMFLLLFNAAAVYFTAKSLFSLTQIMSAVKEISAGNLECPLDSSKLSPAFSSFAEDIQSLQGGLKKAVSEAVKSERMKTDLITNVSHDLKTPLTSIINYVDLLKREELNNQNADEYVGILEEKSGRLKQLIEDLIEASKASSGSLAVKAEKVDLHELVIQACGEYEEKIRNASLDMRISASDKKILVFADGKHMWRIVENLLSNVMKYSMPNSRVYINVDKNERYGLLTIKNISAFPLDISPQQLTERFVRGDVSRTTEGSGLGLSIAQSLTNLQGGRFNIDIDGDLFKVTIEIPLLQEN